MKNKHPFGFLILITIFLSSCSTLTAFDSPNNTENVSSTLYLKDGRILYGFLTIDTEYKKNDKVYFQGGTNRLFKKFKLKYIKGYTTGSNHYLLKETDNNKIVIENGNSVLEQLLTKKKYYFMKQLTPVDSRIHLYENNYLYISRNNSRSTKRVIEYHIQLPQDGSNKVYLIDGEKLVPDFEVKMGALVKDCPKLAEKVIQKQPGYYYAPIHLPILSQNTASSDIIKEDQLSVLLRIIEEYNQCK